MPIISCYQHPRNGNLYEMSDKHQYVADLKSEAFEHAKTKYMTTWFTYMQSELGKINWRSLTHLLDEINYCKEDVLRSFMFRYRYDEFYDSWRAKKHWSRSGGILVDEVVQSMKFFRRPGRDDLPFVEQACSVEIVLNVHDWGYLNALWISNSGDVKSLLFDWPSAMLELEISVRDQTLTIHTDSPLLLEWAHETMLALNSFRAIDGWRDTVWEFEKPDIEEYYGQIRIC